jgi:hypothetical protein
MTDIDEKCLALHSLLDVLNALKPHCDPSNPATEPFCTTFTVVREKAKVAALAYARALTAGDHP